MPKSKTPAWDINALAAYTVKEATGEPAPYMDKNTSAAERGQLGGLNGGKARVSRMTSGGTERVR